ncbi:MAG: hypothetical protein KDB53_14215, partial [Planctomycetes bacterium]|nr:hypothetical protein [Planctomycetota bacterium]
MAQVGLPKRYAVGDINGDGITDILDRSGSLGPLVMCSRTNNSALLGGTASSDTLFVNGSSGGTARVEVTMVGQPPTISIMPFPGATSPPLFGLWGQIGPISLLEATPGPFGTAAFAAQALQPGDPRLFTLTNGLWNDNRAVVPASPAPWSLSLPAGLPSPAIFA